MGWAFEASGALGFGDPSVALRDEPLGSQVFWRRTWHREQHAI